MGSKIGKGMSVSRKGYSSSIQKQRNSKCDSLPKKIEYFDESGNQRTLKQQKRTTYTCSFCNINYQDTIVYKDKDKDIFRCLDCVKKGLIFDVTDSSCLNIAISKIDIFNTQNFKFNDLYESECYSCDKEIHRQGVIYTVNQFRTPIYCLMCVITSKNKIINSKGKYRYKSPG